MPLAPSPSGLPVEFAQTGSGPPVLLLAGLGATAASWAPILDRLADQRRCIVIENRGVGASRPGPGRLRMADMAADACAVLDHLGIAAADVVGNSLGGMIAQALAIGHPRRVRGLVLAATGPGVLAVPAHPAVAWHLAAGLRGRQDLRLRHLAAVFHGPATVVDHPERLRADPPGRAMPAGPGAAGQLRAALRWSSLAALHRITAPTLVLHGTHDRLSPPLNARLLARLIPGARLQLLARCGHFMVTDAGEEAAAAIAGFLDSAPRLRPGPRPRPRLRPARPVALTA